jgi:hypothetical protein
MVFVTADLNDRTIVDNDPDDGDIDDIRILFISPGIFGNGFLSPLKIFIDGFLSP